MPPPRIRNQGANVCHRVTLPRLPPARRRYGRGRHAGAPPPVEEVPVPAPAPRVAPPPPAPVPPEPLPGEAAERQARESAFQREIEVLSRRLSKVSELLELREEELRRLVATGRVAPGIASLYREVQGLDEDSPHAETKREMMKAIFDANLVLQDRIQALGATPPSA